MLTVSHTTKSYGSTRALRDVSLQAAPGEIFAILGENGAGKSTLLKVLAGAVRPDAGSIALDGEALEFGSPRDALRAGFVLIPQELAPVPQLSVAENIMLGRLPRQRGLVTRAAMRLASEPFARQLGIAGLLAAPVSSLSLAEAQLVEIAKALARQARVMLLDEPTASLSAAETARLFSTLDDLRRRDIVMLYISHRLDEVIEHADQVMVMRDGSSALTSPVAEVTKAELVAAMLGGTPLPAAASSSPPPSETPMLAVEGFAACATDVQAEGISFTVHRGEVVGLYGVRGAGQEDVIQAVVGLRRWPRGSLRLDGRQTHPFKTVRQAVDAGIAYVPADRKQDGLVLTASIQRNLAMPQLRQLSTAGVMRPRRERALLADVADTMRLTYRHGAQAVRELSGGNQQKVLVGSRIATAPALLAVHEPTRGVDVGARREIHTLLRRLTDRGTAVLMATTDIEEAVELSDRLMVLRDGRVVSELSGQDKTQQRALHDAVGDVA